MAKRKSSVQEELFIMIYKLIEKKTSEIFREPVDPIALPDYYQKIKNPIDISTITKKLKRSQYQYPYQIKDDFKLLIANCKQYNVRIDILRSAEKFEKSIETEWGNFEKECKKEGLNITEALNITEDCLKAFETIQQKYNRKPQMLQNILGELEQSKKYSAEFKILPPIPAELLQNDKQNDELPSSLGYKPQKYMSMKGEQKSRLLHFDVDCAELGAEFEEMAKKKLNKYKKILYKKIQWIENKIFRKCLERKRFKKMSTVHYLVNYPENDKLANGLQLRNIQMYVKMVAYWVEEYPEILSFHMKNKFIQTCKAIKKAIFRVLRYRRLPRTTKIQVNLNEDEPPAPIQLNSIDQPALEELPEDESKRYDNEIKNFKRMLSKDQSQTIKKYTKITIKWENGEWAIADFPSDTVDKKKTNRISLINRNNQNTEQNMRLEKQRRRNQQKQEDQLFLASFKANNSVELINTYRDKLEFDWDDIFLKKLPKVLEFNTESFLIV